MAKDTVVITGGSRDSAKAAVGNGRSQLCNRILGKPYIANEPSTIGCDTHYIKKDNVDFRFLDLTGNRSLESLYNGGKDVRIVLYCVDLSQEIDKQKTREDIEHHKKTSPNATIILVGTKSDVALEGAQSKLEETAGVNNYYMTSALTNKGIDQLSNHLIGLITNPPTIIDKFFFYPFRKSTGCRGLRYISGCIRVRITAKGK